MVRAAPAPAVAGGVTYEASPVPAAPEPGTEWRVQSAEADPVAAGWVLFDRSRPRWRSPWAALHPGGDLAYAWTSSRALRRLAASAARLREREL